MRLRLGEAGEGSGGGGQRGRRGGVQVQASDNFRERGWGSLGGGSTEARGDDAREEDEVGAVDGGLWRHGTGGGDGAFL
jgi:hypothetical protein